MKSHKTQWEVYYELMLANSTSSLYKTAKAMGLLEIKKAFSVSELAALKKLNETALKVFLESLCGAGILVFENGHYSLSEDMQKLHGPYAHLGQEYWDYLPQFLATGVPFKKSENPVADYQEQVKSLNWMMQSSAFEMVDVLKLKNKELSILDVGAGSGVWSFEILAHNNKAHSTLCDFPFLLEIAKKNNTFSKRTEFLEGNVLALDFGEHVYNTAVMGNISHFHSLENNLLLFKKINHAMMSGGQFILLDAFSTDPRGEFARASYQMGLTIKTLHGRVYKHAELEALMSEAGFTEIQFHPLDVAPYTMGMLVARKK